MTNRLYKIYRVIRAVLFTIIILAVALPVITYVLLSIKPVQNFVRNTAETELTKLLGTNVEIGDLNIYPFNKIEVNNVKAILEGDTIASINNLRAGIDIFDLIARQKITITYAAVIGMDAHVTRDSASAPLNIAPIIAHLQKEKSPDKKSKINLRINTIILRNANLSYDILNAPSSPGRFNPDHIKVTRLRADATIPLISDSLTTVNLKRLDFAEASGLKLDNLTANLQVSPGSVSWSNLNIELPQSKLMIADGSLQLPFSSASVEINPGSHIFLPSLAPVVEQARELPYTLDLSLSANASPAQVDINSLKASTRGGDFSFALHGSVKSDSAVKIIYDLPRIDLKISPSLASRVAAFIHGFDLPTESYSLAASASGNGLTGHADVKATAATDNIDIQASYHRHSLSSPIDFSASGSVDVADLSAIIHKPDFGLSSLAFEAAGQWHNTLQSADASLDISRFVYKGHTYSDISADAVWRSGNFNLDAIISDPLLNVDLTAGGRFGIKSLRDSVNFQASITGFNPANLNLSKTNLTLNADIEASLSDFNPANIEGFLSINNLALTDSVGDSYAPGPIKVTASGPADNRLIELSGDFIKGRINGAVNPVSLPLLFSTIASRAFPALGNDADDAKLKRLEALSPNIFSFDFTLQPTESLRNIVNPPVTSLYPVTLSGNVDSSSGSARVVVDAPYLRQGNKIIEATRLEVIANGISSAKQLSLVTKYPSKDGLTNINLKASGIGNALNLGLDFKIDRAARYDGQVKLSAQIGRSETDNSPTALVKIIPSEITFNDSTWFISPSTLNWADRQLSIDRLEVSRQNQFVKIDGIASASEDDVVNIDIRNFDLGYLFNALSIDNVPLGGYTTGSVTANSVLTPTPHASATNLFVRDISFSDCVIGNAIVNSHFEPENLAIIIDGDVTQADGNHSTISVDLRPMSKELDVNISATHTPVGFLQRYFYAFADNISGTASGNLRIFGSFDNVDLEGRMVAEDVDMRLLFTNVRYQAADSIIITPGRISLPSLAITDPSTRRKATLSGFVTHRNFSDFKINLSLDHIRDMLVFDVKPSDESNYYGHVLASGNASIIGDENLIDIKVDATTSAGSTFTFILDDREVASEYTFLTFRDKNAVTDSVKVVVDEHLQHIAHLRSLFNNKVAPSEGNFNVELQVNVTPEAELDLVMDPVAGDKIKAFGNADLRITYSSATDEMEMFGTYTADRGFYNFTLQEIIIKDFIIEQGSEVAFSGDPLNARLKIKAYYSLNANLTDLDETFANDKDLNRTNVPVHAVLLVDGDIDNPQLSFDIEFPTLTSDVYRKVRSIVSTEEMMNRQIIYLLALNRFYTPDYMSATKGNELFSVASSTITSQLSNILGQLSDKWMIAPNLRSDRGDFSDVEVDVALSSRLLNNRLLLNGNFGYRDKSLNTNQFIGDFDIEYLLNRQGSIRLKAYNHYNDQNYYVRTANTTQGVGIMFKHDFDNIFGFLRRAHRPAPNPSDSLPLPLTLPSTDSVPPNSIPTP